MNVPKFLDGTKWKNATVKPLTGDASARKYFRLQTQNETAILMDAARAPEIIPPFYLIAGHLRNLHLSAPEIFARDDSNGFLLLEDFGDETFSQLLDKNFDGEELFTLATELLISLHKNSKAMPKNLQVYSPEKMSSDVELFLDVHKISEIAAEEFKKMWREILPLAHQVPQSLLLRDFHAANLMWLPQRQGIRRAGILDFQDAHAGPVTYDLISLLEDARRDLPNGLKEKMIACYLSQFPNLDRAQFELSWAILAALRHTRVLAVFEKLSRAGKSDYKNFHSPRVEQLLHEALRHPKLAALKHWFANYAR